MQYRRLGRSGMQVSTVALGSWLTYGTATDMETAKACIRKAYDIGINFFDTANAYNFGAAEEVVGSALQEYARDTFVLATKVYFPMGDRPNQKGLSRKHIVEQCNASLRRLGVEYIDLYQCHRYDTESDLEETLRALDDLIRQGKVLYAGVSEWTAAQIQDAMQIARTCNLHKIVSNQPIYNMLVRYIEKEVLSVCAQQGIGQVVFSPLAQGILTGKYKPGQAIPADTRAANEATNHWISSYLNEQVLQGVEQLNMLAKDIGITLAQLSIAWVLRQPGVSSAIIGASRPQQVEENAKAADIHLSEEILRKIDAILTRIPADPIW